MELKAAMPRLLATLAAVLVLTAAALVNAQARTVEIVVGKTTKAEIIWAYGAPEYMSGSVYQLLLEQHRSTTSSGVAAAARESRPHGRL